MGDGTITISLPPHIVVFPSPVGWPLNSMFDLAELLCLSGIDVTLLLIPYTHSLLLRHIHVESRLNPYPNFRLQIISDGLPPDHSRSDTMELLESLENFTKPIFRDFLASRTLISDERRPLSCIISDRIMSFVYDVADEIHVPVISAFTLSPSCLWILSNLSSHIGDGEVSNQIGGNDENLFIKGVPGFEGILTGGDLASMCRSDDFGNPFWKHLMKQIQDLPRAHGLILNTFKTLDGSMLSRIQSICPNLYPIGPIQAHLWARQEAQRMSTFFNEKNNNCMIWLDSQKPSSILYVNIENHGELTRAQVMELWHGLVNSGKGFLWVRKPESIVGESRVPPKIRKATKERGFIVDNWVSDVHVLAHKAVGGFLTDCRWESILESIVEGVPTICFPWTWDEQVNSRFMSKTWKLGMALGLEERWDRNIMEKTIKDVMGLKGELAGNANKMRKLGKKSVSKGGSSYAMLDHLVDDIRSMGS